MVNLRFHCGVHIRPKMHLNFTTRFFSFQLARFTNYGNAHFETNTKQNKARKKLVLPRKEAKSASFFALLLSLTEQQQVFVSDMTFDATVNPICYEGGIPVFIDMNPYASFCQGEIVVTDIKTAEMTKVVENTFRAVNIAFANELAKICRHDNMDVYEIIKICNMHPRVNILQPGPGVGGHCISVDPWFLVGDYPSLAKVIDESMKTNDGMHDFVLNRIYEIMKEKGMTDITRVGLYGLTYKENVDDMRESPTLQLLESQERHLATGLKVYDPFIEKDVVANQYHTLQQYRIVWQNYYTTGQSKKQ